jgi:iduronate 2-sulfatase
MRSGFLLREDEWAYIQYGENGAKGIELYNIKKDPHQYTSLAQHPAHQETVARFKAQMTGKLRNIRNNDLLRKPSGKTSAELKAGNFDDFEK